MPVKVVVIDYGSGNLTSARRALERAAAEAHLSAEVIVSGEPASVARADRVVLPGQGAFAECWAGLGARKGMREAIGEATDRGAPFLGICVGMELMAERGFERGVTPGFGWIKGEVALMRAPGRRLPHMGWNTLALRAPAHPLLAGIGPDQHVYFVHSYALAGADPDDVLAYTDYGGDVVAMVARGNRAGTQFHVEKSQRVGLRILTNFLHWEP